jgi:hypothetical protein
MSTRGILVFVAICAVIVIAGIAAAIYLSRGFFSDATHVLAEGSAFGRGKDGKACVDEAVRRYDPSQTMVRQTVDSGFVLACLSSAKATDEVCGNVPPMGVFDQAPARAWAEQRCGERDLVGRGCALIFLQVANYCQSRR